MATKLKSFKAIIAQHNEKLAKTHKTILKHVVVDGAKASATAVADAKRAAAKLKRDTKAFGDSTRGMGDDGRNSAIDHNGSRRL